MKLRLLIFALTLPLFSACSTAKRNVARPLPQIVVPPVNPDMAPVRAPVTKAQSSVKRATVIVEHLVPAPGQQAQIDALKLELATTAKDLTDALDKIAVVELQNLDLLAKWTEENQRASALYQQFRTQEDRADNAVKQMKRAAAERDVFVNLFAVSLTIIVLLGLAPLIRNIAAYWPAYAPVLAMGLWAVAAIGAYLGAFWLIRLGLRIFVTL